MTLPRRCEVSSSASVALLAERKTTKIEVTVPYNALSGFGGVKPRFEQRMRH